MAPWADSYVTIRREVGTFGVHIGVTSTPNDMRAPTLVIALACLIALGVNHPTRLLGQAQPQQVLGPPSAGKVQRLTLTDGTQMIGRIVAVTDSTVDFESVLGTSTIKRAHITRVREENAGTTRNGRYYFANPNATRLLFAPTGRMLEQGEGYFADHWIFFPSINLGLTSRFTLGGGMTVFPGISPTDQLLYLTPKFGVVQRPSFNFAVGAFAGSLPSWDDDGSRESAGVLYGVTTWGKQDAHFTAGIGYGYFNDELADRPVLMFGGESRTAPRVSLVTENWLFPGGVGLWTAGLRLFGPGVSVDLAALGAFGEDGACCVPFLGVVWKW